MKTKNLKLTLLILLVLMITLIAAFTSCGGKKVSDIYIAKSNMPKVLYVEGQDLDLSGAALTVVIKDEPGIIPLNSEGVTISGYDKNKVGKQTVTVAYEEKTTTFDVTVIARMTPDGYESDYFVNEEFNKTKGKLRIARDDATTFTVQMNDSAVEIVSFDSSAAGKVAVNVKYVDSKGKNYEGAFFVNVHEIGEVKFTAPNKKSYLSHDTQLNLTGGYFTIKAKDSASFEKKIALSEDTVKITGFDPSVSNISNKDTIQSQDVTFSFAGNTYTFNIKISFSDVSLAAELSKKLLVINWDAEDYSDVVISDELGEIAIEAIAAYLRLSPVERSIVDEKSALALLKTATVYVNQKYMIELEGLSNAFVLNTQGFSITGESYEAVENAISRLEDESDLINVYANILRDLREEFADTVLYKTVKIVDYIMVHTKEATPIITKALSHLLETYDFIADIPDDWTAESLVSYKDEIEDLCNHMSFGDYVGTDYFVFYEIVSLWRNNDDMFDIIYSYLIYTVEEVDKELIFDYWDTIPMPGAMGDWYLAMTNAVYYEQLMSQNYENPQAILYDVTNFMYAYKQLIDICELAKNSDSQLCRDLYEQLNCEMQTESYIRLGSCGYVYHMNYALGLESVESVWAKYLDIIDKYATLENIGTEEFGKDVEAMFASLWSLSPSELNAFLTSLHFRYDSVYGQVFVFDSTNGTFSLLTTLLHAHYSSVLTESAYSLFNDLLVAMEKYSLYYVTVADNALFADAMSSLAASYTNLADEDKASFDKHLGKCYQNLISVCNSMENDDIIVTDAQMALVNEFMAAIKEFENIFQYIMNTGGDLSDEEQAHKNAAFPVLFALYEKAGAIYYNLDADATVGNLLIAKEFDYVIDTENTAHITLDRLYYNVRRMFVTMMLSSSLTDEDGTSRLAWDAYAEAGLGGFFSAAAYLMLDGFNEVTYTGADVADIMAMFASLDLDAKEAFFEFGAQTAYYDALEAYFNAQLSNETVDSEIVRAILNAQIYSIALAMDMSEENVTSFVEYMSLAVDKYEALSESDTLPTELDELYNELLAIYGGVVN